MMALEATNAPTDVAARSQRSARAQSTAASARTGTTMAELVNAPSQTALCTLRSGSIHALSGASPGSASPVATLESRTAEPAESPATAAVATTSRSTTLRPAPAGFPRQPRTAPRHADRRRRPAAVPGFVGGVSRPAASSEYRFMDPRYSPAPPGSKRR